MPEAVLPLRGSVTSAWLGQHLRYRGAKGHVPEHLGLRVVAVAVAVPGALGRSCMEQH